MVLFLSAHSILNSFICEIVCPPNFIHCFLQVLNIRVLIMAVDLKHQRSLFVIRQFRVSLDFFKLHLHLGGIRFANRSLPFLDCQISLILQVEVVGESGGSCQCESN